MEKLLNIARKLEELEENYSKLEWTQYTVGYDFGCQEAYAKIVEFMKDKTNFETICEYRNKDLSFKDKRRAEIMYNAFREYHLSEELNELQLEIQKKTTELSKILNTHRSVFEGREVTSVDLSQILANDDNRERRKAAYFARVQVNKPLVDGGFVELIKLRKKYAKLYGAKDFVDYSLKNQELDASIFENWTSELHEILPKMNSVRSEYAKKYINDDKIMPWDSVYIGSRIAPLLNTTIDISNYYEVLQNFFKNFGIDISEYNITYDVFPRANKSEWGYNFPIRTAKDSRILANVKNKYNEYGVLLHETGHGVHSFLLDPDETILNMGVSGIISEGLANLFGGLLHEKIFFEKFFHDAEKAEEQFSQIRNYDRLMSLRAINDILFDQELYRNKIESLDDIYQLYWKVYKDVLMEEPFADEIPWGYRIHHTTHPIYLHNYFMGDVTCEMLSSVFKKKFNITNVADKPLEFGEFLVNEVIKVSGLYKYQDLFKKISGEEFSLKYMID